MSIELKYKSCILKFIIWREAHTPQLILSFSKATLIAKEKRLSLCRNVDCCGTFYHMLSQVVHCLDNSHILFGNRLIGSSILNDNMKQILSIGIIFYVLLPWIIQCWDWDGDGDCRLAISCKRCGAFME